MPSSAPEKLEFQEQVRKSVIPSRVLTRLGLAADLDRRHFDRAWQLIAALPPPKEDKPRDLGWLLRALRENARGSLPKDSTDARLLGATKTLERRLNYPSLHMWFEIIQWLGVREQLDGWALLQLLHPANSEAALARWPPPASLESTVPPTESLSSIYRPLQLVAPPPRLSRPPVVGRVKKPLQEPAKEQPRIPAKKGVQKQLEKTRPASKPASPPKRQKIVRFGQVVFDADAGHYPGWSDSGWPQLSHAVREVLHERGLTTAECADLAGVSPELLAELLGGRGYESFSRLRQVESLVERLDVSQRFPRALAAVEAHRVRLRAALRRGASDTHQQHFPGWRSSPWPELGAQLAEARESQNVTQQALAAELGCEVAEVRRVEEGAAYQAPRLLALAGALVERWGLADGWLAEGGAISREMREPYFAYRDFLREQFLQQQPAPDPRLAEVAIASYCARQSLGMARADVAASVKATTPVLTRFEEGEQLRYSDIALLREAFTLYEQRIPEFGEKKTAAEGAFDEYAKGWSAALDSEYRRRNARLPAEKQWMVEVGLRLYRAWQQCDVSAAQLMTSARVSLGDLMALENPSRLETASGVQAALRLAESRLLSLTPRDRTFVTERLTQRWSEIVEGYRSEVVESEKDEEKRVDDRSVLLGAHVRAVREAEGLAQQALAKYGQVTPDWIRCIERGEKPVATYDEVAAIQRILVACHPPKPMAHDISALLDDVRSDLEQAFLADWPSAERAAPAAQAALRLHRALMADADERGRAIATCLTKDLFDEGGARETALRAGSVRALPYPLSVKLADFYDLDPSDKPHYQEFAPRINTMLEQKKLRRWASEAKYPRCGQWELGEYIADLASRVDAALTLDSPKQLTALYALRQGAIGQVDPAVCGSLLRSLGSSEWEFALVEAVYALSPQWRDVAASLGRAAPGVFGVPTWREYEASAKSWLRRCTAQGVLPGVVESWLERPPGSLEVMLAGGASRMLHTVEALDEYAGSEIVSHCVSARLVARQRLEDWAVTTKAWPAIAQRRGLSAGPLKMNSQPLFPIEQLWAYDPRIVSPEVMLPAVAKNYSAEFASVHSGFPGKGDVAKNFVGEQGNLVASGRLAKHVGVIVSEFSLSNIEDPQLRAAQARWLMNAARCGVDVLVLPAPREKEWPYPCRVAKPVMASDEGLIRRTSHLVVDLHGNEKSWLPPEQLFAKATDYLKLARRGCLPPGDGLSFLRQVAAVFPQQNATPPPRSHRGLGISSQSGPARQPTRGAPPRL